MEILIALAHILGSIIVLAIFGLVVLLSFGWESYRIQKQEAEEASTTLGVKVEDLDSEELAPKLLQYWDEKFNSELFRNRISDFCGLIRLMWIWFGNIVQALILLAVIWYTITGSTENAVFAWFAVGIDIVFLVVSVIFSLACKLLTGRYPGQAKEARKGAFEWIKDNSELLNHKTKPPCTESVGV